jgi:DNA processing protein
MDDFENENRDSISHQALSFYEEKIVLNNLLFPEIMPGGIINDGDWDYPDSLKQFLGSKRPRILFYKGEKSILEQPSIMVCGSRDASQTGLEIAYKCGRLIAERGYVLASGYARGVDRAAHLGALEGEGCTLAALPYGFSRLRLHRVLREVFDPARFIALSEIPPSYGFTVKSAYRRNKLLAALAEAVIVVEPGESGGTWSSAECASRMKKPLFYFEGERPDIIRFMEPIGGTRLRLREGIPDLEPVYRQCER